MSLNLNKRGKMRKIFLVLGLFAFLNLSANEPDLTNVDRLDVLDQQSKEFFKSITGLEKDYLDEQIQSIKNKKNQAEEERGKLNIQTNPKTQEEVILSDEEFEKKMFDHQNEMARITTDFTRTKKLKDLRIKSMYSFNGKDFVVLDFNDTENQRRQTSTNELSGNIEGRYKEGDYLLGHKIIDINTRTKSVELFKKLDEQNGYTIFLSNYGISVSELQKIDKIKSKRPLKEEAKKQVNNTNSVKDTFSSVSDFSSTNSIEINNNIEAKQNNQNKECYTVNKANLNVRVNPNEEARILRVLKINDIFTVQNSSSDWLNIGTIYKKISGDVMNVSSESNWVQNTDNSLRPSACK